MAGDYEETYDVSKFDRPSVAVDVVLFTIKNGDLQVVLVKRKYWPDRGKWAIPGGFVKMDESLEEAALRELREETGVKDVYLEQLYTFGDPKRDPRTRVITVSYFALADENKLKNVRALKEDVEEVKIFSMKNLPELAFDHKEILEYALKRLRYKLEYTAVGLELLPEHFTLTELQKMYEIILGGKLDKRNFRKKIAALGILEETNLEKKGAHRPARLYSFKKGVTPKTTFKRVQFEG